MKSALHRLSWPALVLLMLPAPASAQPTQRGNPWAHGTTLNMFAGVATDSADTGPLAGGAFGWEITPAIALEGSGSWLDRGPGAYGFAAALKVQAGLFVPHPAVPFVEAGVGMYRASFDPTVSAIPDFYRRRISDAASAAGTTSTFTDPSLVLGGGLNIYVTDHLALRPDVEFTLLWNDSHSYVITAVAVRAAYHFEHHPVTPTRTSR